MWCKDNMCQAGWWVVDKLVAFRNHIFHPLTCTRETLALATASPFTIETGEKLFDVLEFQRFTTRTAMEK